jgi:hypothetical protein
MLTAQDIQLPEEAFEALKGKVFKVRQTRKVNFRVSIGQVFNYHPVTGRRIAPFSGPKVTAQLSPITTLTIGEYGLNAIRSIIYDQDFVYQGQAETGEFLFFKEEVNFTLSGVTHHIPAAMKILRVIGGSAEVEDVIDPSEYSFTYTVNGVKTTVNYSSDEVAAMLNLTPEQFEASVYTKWIATSPDPTTNITSVFAIPIKTDEGYVTSLYVNEQIIDPANYIAKATHYGKRTSVKLHYIAYNDCTSESADSSAGYESGNFGACAKFNNRVASEPIDLPFDLTKEFAVLEARFCEQPESGKEYRVSGYFDAKANEVIPALPRKTGNGVVFI